MKVIILGPAHPYRGGIAAFNERLALEFQKEGHEVQVVTFTLQYPSFLFPGTTQYSTEPPPAGLVVTRGLNSVNPFNWLTLGRRLRREAADLLVVAYWLPFMAPCLGTVARMVRRGGRTRVVAVLHNLIPHEHRPGDRLFSRYFIGSVHAAVSLSKSVLADLDQFDRRLPRAFSPHPLYDNFGPVAGREEACRHLGLDPTCRYLLFFGLIRAYKGLDLLLEALADSRLRGSGMKLIVAGEFYANGEQYLSQARSLGLEDVVVWHTHFVPDSEVRYYFSAADLVVQPYKSATQSGVTQIAYHFERPMLVTRVGGLPEIVPHGKAGYVVDLSPSAIAGAIADFNRTRPDFSQGLHEEKKKYAWPVMVRTIIGLA